MRVFVTGATGFIGSAVLTELIRRNIRPVVLLRPESDLRRLPKLSEGRTIIFSKLDEPGLVEYLRAQEPAVFIHCAWRGVGGGGG